MSVNTRSQCAAYVHRPANAASQMKHIPLIRSPVAASYDSPSRVAASRSIDHELIREVKGEDAMLPWAYVHVEITLCVYV